MKFEVKELTDEKLKYFEIDDKINFKLCKDEIAKANAIAIDFNYLNLGIKLYADNKKESIEIQKANCKHMMKVFKVCKKIVKLLTKHGSEFDGVFYIKGLKDKKNNNDFMLVSMLDVALNYVPFSRLGMAVNYSCDYLDKENALHNMCES